MNYEIKKLKLLLKSLNESILEELERGYVLTYETNAGSFWKKRWNNNLSKCEEALKLLERLEENK